MKNNKKNTPLVCCLKKYARKKPLRMHMPCHGGRLGFVPPAEKIDVTELGFNDNLNSPKGVIAQSQELFARTFGANHAIFLTNGSSQGIYAFFGALSGKRVMVEQDAHVSVTRGAKLFGVDLLKVPTISAEILSEELKKGDIDGVLVRYPDYFGKTVDLKSIFEVAQRYGVKMFVDGAHGAHFGLCDKLPPHPSKYCDACVVSTHKTLGALTQTAVVLTNDEQTAKLLKEKINITSTTSPSYVLMASIDYARDYANRFGKKKLDKLYENLLKLKKNLPKGVEFCKTEDFCKLCLNFEKMGICGRTAFEFLASRNVFAELYKGDCVLFYLGMFTTKAHLNRLKRALKSLAKKDFYNVVQQGGDGPFEFGD